jgi:hypothetical protein
MATTYAPETVPVVAVQPGIKPAAGLLLPILLVLIAGVVIYMQQPPAVTAGSVSPQEFSSQRAMNHLQTIAKAPHPTGSSENKTVREYLVRELTALGAEPQVQTATVIDPAEALPYVAGTVQNVVARFKGTSNGKAVLLMSHYDSAPTAPGASDDGAAVAALLEAARALKAGPPLRNDVIFLLTDGEEPGRFGARAFINEHLWAKDVGLVFNFEARGNSGPSIMFETSRQNGWLVREFAEAAPHPFANSLAGTIYDSLPNDTDFTITKRAGLPGLNFAYINGLTDYHTQTDNLENIDQRSLQHQGANVLAVARHFGNIDFSQPRARDAVYFDLPGGFLAHYSSAWIIPLVIVAVVAFAAVVFIGRKRELVTLKGIVFGFVALIVSCIAANIITMLVWTVVRTFHAGFRLVPWGDTYNSGFYKIAFVLLTIGIVSAIHAFCRKRTSVANLAVGAMLGWLLLTVTSAFVLPGGSYLFTWPLLFALAGTAILFYSRQQRSLVLAAYALPAIILFGPLIYWLFIALTVSNASTVVIPVALLLGLLTPHLDVIAPRRGWSVPVAAVVLSLIFIIAGLATAGFSNRHPRMNQIFYGLNADNGKAVWGSIDARPDEWTTQFLTANPKRERMPDLFPLTGLTFLQSDAVAAPLEAPKAQVLEDRREGDVRVLRLQISSTRRAPVMSAYLDAAADVVSASLNGKTIEAEAQVGKPWGLQYHGLPEEGAELILRVRSTQPVTLRIDDRTYELPVIPNTSYRARPENLTPVPSQYSDTTVVSKTYTF